MLYRVFPFTPGTDPDPLSVPRHLQGSGRHDNPEHYTAWYLAREPIAAVAERIQGFRGTVLDDGAFIRRDGARLALATIDDGAWPSLIDLDDPARLVAHRLRPSRVATGDRSVTQRIALDFFEAGETGMSWWSTLEAGWTNVTVFAERIAEWVAERILPISIEPLAIGHPVVRAAADFLAIERRVARPVRPGI